MCASIFLLPPPSQCKCLSHSNSFSLSLDKKQKKKPLSIFRFMPIEAKLNKERTFTLYGTHISLLINTQVLLFPSARVWERRNGARGLGVHSSDACNNIVQSSSREWDINTSICLYVQLFSLFAFNKTRTVDELIFRYEFLPPSSYSSSFFRFPFVGAYTRSIPKQRTVDEARTMRCLKPSQTFFTPQSIRRVYVPLKMYNVHKNTISNIIFIEWMNELKFFWFSFLLLCLLSPRSESCLLFRLVRDDVFSSGRDSYSFSWVRNKKKRNRIRCDVFKLFFSLPSFRVLWFAPKLSKVAMWDILLGHEFHLIFCCSRDCHYSIANRHKILSARYMCSCT